MKIGLRSIFTHVTYISPWVCSFPECSRNWHPA